MNVRDEQEQSAAGAIFSNKSARREAFKFSVELFRDSRDLVEQRIAAPVLLFIA